MFCCCRETLLSDLRGDCAASASERTELGEDRGCRHDPIGTCSSELGGRKEPIAPSTPLAPCNPLHKDAPPIPATVAHICSLRVWKQTDTVRDEAANGLAGLGNGGYCIGHALRQNPTKNDRFGPAQQRDPRNQLSVCFSKSTQRLLGNSAGFQGELKSRMFWILHSVIASIAEAYKNGAIVPGGPSSKYPAYLLAKRSQNLSQ